MDELFTREQANPLLSPADWPYPVNSVFNPGAAVADGQTVLLCRVEDRRGLSQLTVARSDDGITGWRIDPEPLIRDNPGDEAFLWGAEDPRVTRVDELGGWVITYTAYGPQGPSVALSITRDFRTAELIGMVMPPEDKNACLLPRSVDGSFVLFHRPHLRRTGRSGIWLSRSLDLRSWTAPEPVLSPRDGGWWDSARVGMGPPPVETPQGWVGIYHGVKDIVAGPVYRAGLVLLDLHNPAKVLRRSDSWILAPSCSYERVGDVPNVIFPTGLIHDTATGELRLYYGAADTCIAMARARLSDVLEHLLSSSGPG